MKYIDKITTSLFKFISPRFFKNFSLLFFGSVVNQLIAFLAFPILTRLYTPLAFGYLELFIATGSFVSVLANFRFESIIGLVHESKEAHNVLIICFVFNLFFCLLAAFGCFLGIFLFNLELIYAFLPIYILISAFSESLKYYQLRLEHYKNVASFRTSKVIWVQLFCFLMAYIGFSHYGLIFGTLLGEIIACTTLLYISRKNFSFHDFSTEIIKTSFKKNMNMALTLFSSQLIGAGALRIPSFFIAAIGSKEELGYYSICKQILAAPLMIAENIGSIYRQEAIREYHELGNFQKCFSLYFLKIIIVTCIIFSFLFLESDLILKIVIGTYPQEISFYFYILVCGGVFQFISTPLDKGAQIVNAKKYIFFWHSIRIFLMISGSILCYYVQISTLYYLIILTSIHSFLYLFDIGYEYYLSWENKNDRN